MNIIMVDYDLISPGQKYEAISKYMKQHSWAHALLSKWIVETSKTVEQVLADMQSITDANDKVIVTDITGARMAWHGLPTDVSNWIQNNNPARALYR